MKKWPLSTISAVADVFDGPHATPKTIDHGAIFLGIDSLDHGRLNLSSTRHVTNEDFKKWTKRIKPEAGDIVFSYETRLGEVAIIPEGLVCCLGRRMALIRTDRSVLNEKFFLYYFMSPQFQEQIRKNTINGATVDRIPLKDFPSFKLELPPLDEQHTIASILGSLDDKIDLNRRTNETLEAMARALFRDWFVDFGPTRAKMAGEAPYLAPELWELFPDRLNDEGKPEGWKIGELHELTINICNGGTPKRTKSSYWENGDIPWLTSGEVRKQYISETENHITNEGLENSSAKWIPAGSIVIALYGATAGEVGLTATKMTTNQAISSLIPKGIGKSYIFLHMLHSKVNLANKATGSAQQNLSKNLIETFETLIPSEKILYEFENKTSLLFDRIIKNLDESHILAQLRDLLLPKLMSGEISIRDAEKMVEDAA
ncbi:restriction endonuclease subunit S [Acetobacter persici]|uniref:restriction endonuclease subunit S n=1 Tax=Acetobacter persici TaxID=1076596 RepID=UPI001F2B14C5|nr:restriction endonuclease subunit S [Acetobacter persici]MCG0999070.1 restriction endonuclease subunit S [Acetobacter persici]